MMGKSELYAIRPSSDLSDISVVFDMDDIFIWMDVITILKGNLGRFHNRPVLAKHHRKIRTSGFKTGIFEFAVIHMSTHVIGKSNASFFVKAVCGIDPLIF